MTAPRHRTFLAARSILLATLFALVPRMEAAAIGLKVDLVPSARIEEGWESNVSNSSTNETSSLATRVSPGLAMSITTADDVKMRLSGNYEKVWYHNSDVNRSNNDTFHFRVDTTGDVRLTPTFYMVPSVSYINTTNSFRRTQLVPSGDPELPPVAITNYGNTETETFRGGLRFNYLATPLVTISIDGNYSNQRFSSPDDNTTLTGTGLTDSSSYGAGTSIAYRFSPRSKLGVRFSGSRFTNDGNPDSNTIFAGVTFGHQFSPTVQFDGNIGVQNIKRDAAPGIPEESKSSPAGRFQLSYKQETITFALFGSADYSGVSGFGSATRQYTVGMRFIDRFARDWTWNLSGAYQVSRSVFSENAVNIHSINGATGFQYHPWRWATLDLTGILNRQTSSGQFGETLNNYSAYLGFTAAYSMNLY